MTARPTMTYLTIIHQRFQICFLVFGPDCASAVTVSPMMLSECDA